jgi:hypothetical protein
MYKTNIHALGGIRTQDPSKRSAEDLALDRATTGIGKGIVLGKGIVKRGGVVRGGQNLLGACGTFCWPTEVSLFVKTARLLREFLELVLFSDK